jgi:hypothetical protein
MVNFMIDCLSKHHLYVIGKFDNGGRYTLHYGYETKSSKQVRTPSRSWPFSVWNHCKTKKYFASLSLEQKLELLAVKDGSIEFKHDGKALIYVFSNGEVCHLQTTVAQEQRRQASAA